MNTLSSNPSFLRGYHLRFTQLKSFSIVIPEAGSVRIGLKMTWVNVPAQTIFYSDYILLVHWLIEMAIMRDLLTVLMSLLMEYIN
ncbi:hypothetical protein VIGAN_08365400 [Vigna angularis var. angularis]|uniref:Uncharacterized protein n=1 Tax=Vigna angularis var. angularis TaxID=157739 RepID=A0A0S3SV55_PHAAN|nr:hypothetical protein VIGAN_08365400 [Vigna angularis var. angularis]